MKVLGQSGDLVQNAVLGILTIKWRIVPTPYQTSFSGPGTLRPARVSASEKIPDHFLGLREYCACSLGQRKTWGGGGGY